MSLLRIAMVAACPYPTTQGTQVYIRGLTRALVDRGHEVHVVAYHFGEELPADGACLHRIPGLPGYSKLRAGPAWGKPLLDAQLLGTLLRVVRRHRIDVLHAHNYEAPLAAYAVRGLLGAPVVYGSHNLMVDELHSYFRTRLARSGARWLARRLDRAVPRRGDGCVVISEEAYRAHLDLGVERERLRVILPAVHPDDLPLEQTPPSQAPTVVYAGNPDRYQELPLLFESFRRVLRDVPSARLRLVSSAELGGVRRDAVALGVPAERVELHTTTHWPEVRRLLASAWVAAVPRGLCRGFPMKLLNYLGLACPTVACVGSAKIGVPGLHLAVVPDGDSWAFGVALARLLSNRAEARRMGESARALVLSEHRWSDRVPAFEQAYRSALAVAPARRAR